MAMYLQALALKLGVVGERDLAQACRCVLHRALACKPASLLGSTWLPACSGCFGDVLLFQQLLKCPCLRKQGVWQGQLLGVAGLY